MKVLAIGRMKGKDIAPHIPAEQKAVAELRAAGLVEEVFLKADATGPVLLLTDATAAEAHERLKALPFVQEDLVAFDYIELSGLPRGDHR